jgi:DNA-binding NtrC family response regulator
MEKITLIGCNALDHVEVAQALKNLGYEAHFLANPTLEELEKRYIETVLEKTRGRKEQAAKILGINRRTLYRKEREYGWVTEAELSND